MWGKHSRLNATKICEEKKCIGIEKTKSSAKMHGEYTIDSKRNATKIYAGKHSIQQAERYWDIWRKTQYTTSGALLRYMQENTVYNKRNATEIYAGKHSIQQAERY
jgi:hypothetical protein